MIPRVVTFDCAQTLLEVDWSIKRYVADCCAELKLEIPLEGPSLYEQMYHERLGDYVRVNMTRDHEACDAWWIALDREWLAAIGLDPGHAERLQETSERVGFGPQSILFRIYDDVLPCLADLKARGIRVGVLSNWDYSLYKALAGAGLQDEFELVVASLEHGVEKPDPRLFQVVLDHFEVAPEEIVHVGDNPVDDLEGARGVRMRGVLIDRSMPRSEAPVLHDLRNLPEAFEWID